IVSLWSPLFFPRYTLVFLPAWALALGLGLRALPQRAAAALSLALLAAQAIALVQLYGDPRYQRDDLRRAIATIGREWRPGDAVVLANARIYPAYEWYAGGPPAWHGRLTDADPAAGRDGVHVYLVGKVQSEEPADTGPSPEF